MVVYVQLDILCKANLTSFLEKNILNIWLSFKFE